MKVSIFIFEAFKSLDKEVEVLGTRVKPFKLISE